MSSFFWGGGGGNGWGWRNSGYTFKWNYSVSLLLTLLRILLRNKWWHWKSASTSSTIGYSILKRPFEMQLRLGAASFCILVYSENEKKRYYSRSSFQKCQKTNASHTFIFKLCHLSAGEEKLTSRALNAKGNTLSLPHRLLLPLEKEFWPEAKPKKVLSHTES